MNQRLVVLFLLALAGVHVQCGGGGGGSDRSDPDGHYSFDDEGWVLFDNSSDHDVWLRDEKTWYLGADFYNDQVWDADHWAQDGFEEFRPSLEVIREPSRIAGTASGWWWSKQDDDGDSIVSHGYWDRPGDGIFTVFLSGEMSADQAEVILSSFTLY